MKPIPPGGVMLLSLDEASELLGSEERLRLCEDRGFITAIDTPLGPRWREDELVELRDSLAAVLPALTRLTPGQAAYILGVCPDTLRDSEWGRALSRDSRGLYDAGEVREVRAQRDALRRERRQRREYRMRQAQDAAKRRRAAVRAVM